MTRQMERLAEEMLASGRDPILYYNFTDSPQASTSRSSNGSTASRAKGQQQPLASPRKPSQQPAKAAASSSGAVEQWTDLPAQQDTEESELELTEEAQQSEQEGGEVSGQSRPSLASQLAAWEEGLPHAGGLPPAQNAGSSRSDASAAADTSSDEPPPSSTATPSSPATSSDAGASRNTQGRRPPRPVNLTVVDGNPVVTLDEHTKPVEATAAIRAALAKGRPLEVHCDGDLQLGQGMALLAAAARQLQRRAGGAMVVLQVAPQPKTGALNVGQLRLIARSVKGLSVEASPDLQVKALINRDAFGELLASRMAAAAAPGAPPPLCGIEVTGGVEVLGAVLRGLVVARKRLTNGRADMSVALDVAAAAGTAGAPEVWKLVCMRCPRGSPHLLSWYTTRQEQPAGGR